MISEIIYDINEGFFISIFSILVVFITLYGLTVIVSLFKNIKEEKTVEILPSTIVKPFGIEDITDELMMVAAIVASIEAKEEYNTDIRITSIKEIK